MVYALKELRSTERFQHSQMQTTLEIWLRDAQQQLPADSGPVAWGSNKQTAVALSTTEADYMASFLTAKERVWLRNLLNEISVQQQSPRPIYTVISRVSFG